MDFETLIDIVLVGFSVVILFLGCRGMLTSGIRERTTYMLLTGIGVFIAVVEMLDVFEVLPRNVFMRELVGEIEIFVLLLIVLAMWQYRRARKMA